MLRSLTNVVLSVVLAVSAVVGIKHYATDNYSMVRQATVLVSVGDVGSCSGVAISKEYVLTAAHCDAPNLMVNGRPAFKVKIDKKHDLLLLAAVVDGPTLKVAKVRPAVDSKVALSGYPLGMAQVVTEGRLQAFPIDPYLVEHGLMVITAQGIFGNSGGPAVVRNGMSYEVVGIASALPMVGFGSPVTHLALMVSTESINEFLN